MVGDDEDGGVLVDVREQAPHQLVDVLVIVEDRVFEAVARLVLAVLGVHELPESVVHAVHAHLDHDEELPRLRDQEVLGEREAAVRHLVDLPQEVVLVLGAEIAHVQDVLADHLLDLALQHRRERVRTVRRRRQEAAHHDAVQRSRRKRSRHPEDDGGLAGAGRVVPQPRLLDRRRVGDEEGVVGVVGAVTEAVDA